MKDFILTVLLVILLGEITYLYFANSRSGNVKVLSEATTAPRLSPTPLPTESPTPSPSPTPTRKPTPTPTPQPKYTSEEINGFIEKYAGQYNVDPNLIRHIALCESGFKPFAKSLSYAGLFQFGPITWQNIRVEMGENKDINLRFNADAAVKTAAYVLHINNAGIWPNCVHN